MTIAKGDKLPDVTLVKATAEGPQKVQSGEYFKGKKVALFSVPGAFTPTCSAKHLPGFVEKADELKAKGTKPALAGALDGRQLRARHPKRRMRLLQRFWHDVAQGNVEIFAVMFAAAIAEHREDRTHGFVEDFLLGLHVAAERRQLRDRGALAHAELATAVAEQIEHRDPLGNPRRMIGGELEDAVAEADVLGALAGGSEE